MLKKYQDEVAAAEVNRRHAQMSLENASRRWQFQKRRFFTNPVNLLLPFTIGALLASKGSSARQAVDWSRVISTAVKLTMSVYPLFLQLTKREPVPVSAQNRSQHMNTHDT